MYQKYLVMIDESSAKNAFFVEAKIMFRKRWMMRDMHILEKKKFYLERILCTKKGCKSILIFEQAASICYQLCICFHKKKKKFCKLVTFFEHLCTKHFLCLMIILRNMHFSWKPKLCSQNVKWCHICIFFTNIFKFAVI